MGADDVCCARLHGAICCESWYTLHDLLWTPAQRSLSEVHFIFCECFFSYFYGPLMLRPWLTEVRETFTRGGPWVWIEKLLLGFFPGPPKTTGWAKKWRNLAYFQTPLANFLLLLPNAAEYCNSEKSLLSTDGCSIRMLRLMNFGIQTPEIHAS